jgi:hypothetical protein
VAHHLQYSPVLREQPWVRYHVKDGEKGLIIWEAKQVMLFPVTENGLQTYLNDLTAVAGKDQLPVLAKRFAQRRRGRLAPGSSPPCENR